MNKTANKIIKFNTSSALISGIIGKAGNNIDYSMEFNLTRKKEIDLLASYLGIDSKYIISLNQVHGDTIIIIDKNFINNNSGYPDADGMITDLKQVCLVIRTADCVPVFAFDAKRSILGVVHSGWKGCKLDISGKLIRKMKEIYHSKPENIHIYILPSIGPDSYSIKMDVGEFFKSDLIIQNDLIFLDLWQNISKSMIIEGIPASNIHVSKVCTYKNNHDFFSFRHGDAGRNINFALIDS